MTTINQNSSDWYPRTAEEINEYLSNNTNLIHSMLKHYRGCDEYDDLFQEASVGFYKGCVSYRPNKGVKLSTYVYECARNQVKMYLRRKSAKSRTAMVVSLDATSPDGDGSERDSLLNQDWGERDTMRSSPLPLEDIVCQKDIMTRSLDIISEFPYEWRIVLYRYMEGIPQSKTAAELESSQANVSKMLKYAICELRHQLTIRGIIGNSNEAG